MRSPMQPPAILDGVVKASLVLSMIVLTAACEPREREDAGEDAASAEAGATDATDATAGAAADAAPITVADVGFATPESVLHDEEADLYLVSNINGAPLDKDGNGFISRLGPDGQIQTLRWIDGGQEGVTLHAPKGMAIKGDTLFVADIDSVRAFDRTSGAALGGRGVPDASFLNDLAVGDEGVLYVSDTGLGADFSPTGTAAVYRFDPEGPRVIARGEGLSNPNGLLVDGSDVLMVPFGGNVVWRIPSDGGGEPSELATLPAGQLDGIVRGADGSFYVSSWEGSAIYRVRPGGEVEVEVEGLESPADLGWDAGRNRLMIPLFSGDRVEMRGVR